MGVQTHSDVTLLFVHRSLWRHITGGGN